MDVKSFYQRQISLSEWFEHLDNFDVESFRKEDNEKRERLRVLNKTIGLPYDEPTQFKAIDLIQKPRRFTKFYKKHKNEYCALRLIPINPKLPKLRMRGLTVEKAIKWYDEQNINPKEYNADFIPHSENPIWSTIFIINSSGVFGEIIKGMHNQLTQGYYSKNRPFQFKFDFKILELSKRDTRARKHLQKVIGILKVDSRKKRSYIENKLNGSFSNNYLNGYFETISTKEYGLWFIDYNRQLGKAYSNFNIKVTPARSDGVLLKGRTGSKGNTKGVVRIVYPDGIRSTSLSDNEVLVCNMTSPDYVMLMKQAAAIITNKGGVLCHAAIISREFNKPCIVATNNATDVLHDGDVVEVDADHAVVRILKHTR